MADESKAAFPVPNGVPNHMEGMTLREYIAVEMAKAYRIRCTSVDLKPARLAELALADADTLLAALKES